MCCAVPLPCRQPSTERREMFRPTFLQPVLLKVPQEFFLLQLDMSTIKALRLKVDNLQLEVQCFGNTEHQVLQQV